MAHGFISSVSNYLPYKKITKTTQFLVIPAINSIISNYIKGRFNTKLKLKSDHGQQIFKLKTILVFQESLS